MPKVKHDNDIELQCTLCPKDPRFSDISHLLTHISSKSHLAHRFKLEIRAQSEIECKEKLEDFAFWYNENGLDVLLSERMAAKDDKKAKKAKASNTSAFSKAPTVPKKEKKAKPRTVKEVLASTPVFRAPIPRMQAWPTEGEQEIGTKEWEPNTMYTTPTARRRIPNFSHQETPTSSKVDPNLTTPVKHRVEDADSAQGKKPGESFSDSAKLKGIVWPGMDLFDSATPEMKRMRNQRKDHTVLEDMIAYSLASEPAEVSFHANGDFRGSRDIFGPLSAESSPARSVPSPKKKKPRQSTKALSNLSTNAPHIRALRAKKAMQSMPTRSSPRKRQIGSMQAPPSHTLGSAPVFNPLANFDRRYVPSAEEDEEFRLTVGNMSKKRGFTIFQDIPEVSPGRTETPLEDHRFDFFAPHGLSSYPSNGMNSTIALASPTPVPRPTTFRISGKENGLPETLNYHHNRRSLSDSQVYPPHVYHEGNSNPLFSHSFARPYGFGMGPSTYTGFGDSRSPNSFNFNFLNDYNRQPNPMTSMGQQEGHGMGQQAGNNASMNNFGI
ncbi:uncharacterized protein RSE6_10710 [Rhynchosporium secalis]|uniref:Uncharacterized protein n=1 Tax=Rhynchosporium secalis TaxID=38038 RepID=A0A1E1ML58_RHYSE|nr:uncharacterized protein RSE6_10710 [Rhynchosporium secalis]